MNILNFILLAGAVIIAFTTAYPLLKADINITIPKAKETALKKAENAAPEKIPTTLDYVLVTEKNLFHPERRLPLGKKDEQAAVRPDIVYYGSIITSEKRIAYIEDKKNPYSTPGRGTRQTMLAQGAVIGGYTLKEVNPETLVLVRGDDKIIVNLRDQKARKPGETTGKPQAPQGQIQTPPPMPPRIGHPSVPRPPTIPPPMPARPVIKK